MAKERGTILLIEDEAVFREQMRKSFGRYYRIIDARTAQAASKTLQINQFDLILLDLNLDEDQKLIGLRLLKPFKQYAPDTSIIVVTKEQSTRTTVEAMKAGADDFIRKSEFDAKAWKKLFDQHIANKRKLTPSDQQDSTENKSKSSSFIGESPKIKEIKDVLRKLSEFPDITVLITGETGVGKEVAARYLHDYGKRKGKPFKAVNLTAVSESLMESELFGHKKGAFTHAHADKEGAFQEADGGILLLDEIGEIGANIQVKLLRFLENKVITPVGGKDVQLDLQIVGATNKDLKKAVQEEGFRSDLFYRLNQYEVHMPPLRERPTDVHLLIDHYLKVMDENPETLHIDTREKLVAYHWPGNVRQLVNVLKKALVDKKMRDQDMITNDLLPSEILHPTHEAQGFEIKVDSPEEKTALTELRSIEEALQHHARKGDAAKSLGWDLDKLKYTIVNKHFGQRPDLVKRFPAICEKYKNFIK